MRNTYVLFDRQFCFTASICNVDATQSQSIAKQRSLFDSLSTVSRHRTMSLYLCVHNFMRRTHYAGKHRAKERDL